jgi:hypothetical protein
MYNTIKVGFCIAYDWQLLAFSLPRIYESAELICISIDKDRISWSGNSYQFDYERFRAFIASVDFENKIRIVEEDYHLPNLTPMQNEVRQRNMLAVHMGKEGWHIQLDSDEYFLDFSGFAKYLRSLPIAKSRTVNICCPLFVLFKKLAKGYLCIKPVQNDKMEYIQIASQNPHYEYGRRNGRLKIYTNFALIHQSWARNEDEIRQKVSSWGHVNDFDVNNFLLLWKNLDDSNYNQYKNFHPIQSETWPALELIPASDIQDLIAHYMRNPPDLSPLFLKMKNSRFLAMIKSIISEKG